MSNTPTIGPGQTEMCAKCVEQLKRELEQRKRDVEYKIAENIEQHPEILNGNTYLRDLLHIWRRHQNESVFNSNPAGGA